eukprot:357670-Chlamydomonas_euryale.AAC.1
MQARSPNAGTGYFRHMRRIHAPLSMQARPRPDLRETRAQRHSHHVRLRVLSGYGDCVAELRAELERRRQPWCAPIKRLIQRLGAYAPAIGEEGRGRVEDAPCTSSDPGSAGAKTLWHLYSQGQQTE